MSDPKRGDRATNDDLTKHPEGGNSHGEGATEDEFVPVGGPRSGDREEGGTEDAGVDPRDEITPG